MTGLLPEVLRDDSGPRGYLRDLVISHLDLADTVASRFHKGGPDADDIRQVARLGLLKAARRYEATRGVPFKAFAEPTIVGEIKRYFRDSCWLVRPPRNLQEVRAKVRGVFPELMQQLGREPSLKNLAETLQCHKGVVSEAMQCGVLRKPASLESQWGESLDGGSLTRATAFDDDGFEHVEDRLFLGAALATVSRAERRLLYLRFVEGLSQQQVAVELGVSQMQVSRLLKATLAKLRRLLTT